MSLQLLFHQNRGLRPNTFFIVLQFDAEILDHTLSPVKAITTSLSMLDNFVREDVVWAIEYAVGTKNSGDTFSLAVAVEVLYFAFSFACTCAGR